MLDFDLAETKAGQEIFQEGIDKGLLQEAHQMVLDGIDARFGVIPDDIVMAVKAIKDREMLHALHRKIFNCDNLETFRSLLKAAKRGMK